MKTMLVAWWTAFGAIVLAACCSVWVALLAAEAQQARVGLSVDNQTPQRLAVSVQPYQICAGKRVDGPSITREVPVGLAIGWSVSELPTVDACAATVTYAITARSTDAER